MIDSFGRNIDYLRISITDRCNLRCVYCMPYDVPDIPHSEILHYEEILRVCGIMARLGVKNVRVTGGEPLVRKGCACFLREIKLLPGIETVSITTNGLLFPKYADELIDAGLNSVNISLDTVNGQDFRRITGFDGLEHTLSAIETAVGAGLRVKINCVLARGLNDGQIIPIARLAEKLPVDVRFIELMPKGYAGGFDMLAADEIIGELKREWPDLKPDNDKRGFGPAKYYKSACLKGRLGFITAISGHFCESCNRLRLTSNGFLKLCLYHPEGIDLRGLLRSGADDAALKNAILDAVQKKPERHFFGSEDGGESVGMSKIGG